MGLQDSSFFGGWVVLGSANVQGAGLINTPLHTQS